MALDQQPPSDVMTPSSQQPLLEVMTPGSQQPLLEVMTPSSQQPLLEVMTPSSQQPLLEVMTPSSQQPLLEVMTPGSQQPLLEVMAPSSQQPLFEVMTPSSQQPLLEVMTPSSQQRQSDVMTPSSQQPSGFMAKIKSKLRVPMIIFLMLMSLSDLSTDFFKGWQWLTKDVKIESERASFRFFGVLALAANWLPGIVAAIHLLEFHRASYFTGPRDTRMQEILKFFLMILVCVLLYPLLPPIGYLLSLCCVNPDEVFFWETFTEMTIGIGGCVEGPIQLCLTIYLMLVGLLKIPLYGVVTYELDQFGNEVLQPDIPIISILFSFLSIVTSTVKLNKFNVSEYLPMYLHSILYRVAAYSFFCVFLHYYAFFPFFIILICNVVIGCLIRPEALKGHIREKHNTYVNNHSKNRLAKAHQELGNTPVGLNSFLGMFTPFCYITGPSSDFLDILTPEEYNEVQKQLAKHQKKILRWQTITSTIFILLFTSLIFILIRFTERKYTPNILSFWDFDLYCGLIVVQSIISLSFVIEADNCKRFGLFVVQKINSQRSQHIKFLISFGSEVVVSLLKRIQRSQYMKFFFSFHSEVVVSLMKRSQQSLLFKVVCCLFLFALPLSVCFLSMYTAYPNVYIVSKSENSIILEMIKGKMINKELSKLPIQQSSTKCSVFNDIGDFNGKILILDQDCISKNIPSVSSKNDIEENFKGAAGILFVSNQKYKDNQRPWNYHIFHSVTEFPIILVDFFDGPKLKDMSGDVIELHAGDISKLLLDDTSSIYKKKCSSFPYIDGVEYNVFHNKERKGFYLGCKGNIKKSIKNLLCQEKGRECPEIEHFENILLRRDPFGECNDMENRPTDQFKNHLLPNWICTDISLNSDHIFNNESTYVDVDNSLPGHFILQDCNIELKTTSLEWGPVYMMRDNISKIWFSRPTKDCIVLKEGMCYKVLTDRQRNWADSRAECQRAGGDLASIKTSNEWQFVKGLLQTSGTNTVWLGGSNAALEGTWVWTDGSSVTFSDWAPGDPNEGSGGYCMEASSYGSWRWYDSYCTYTKYAVCKIPVSA